MKTNKLIFFSLFIALFSFSHAQENRITKIETKLNQLAKETPGLAEKVELSVNGSSIQEFIRGIAITNSINVSVDPSLSMKIYNNFTNVTVSDVFLFLCKKYDLDITFIGNIMSFTALPQAKAPTITYIPKDLKITYDKTTDLITFDFSSDSISQIVRALTKASQKNVVFAPELSGKLISGYIENLPFRTALEKMAFANDLTVNLTEDGIYLLEKKDVAANKGGVNAGGAGKPAAGKSIGSLPAGLTIKKDEFTNVLSVDANNMPIADVISYVFKEMNLPYFLFSEIKGNTTLRVTDVPFADFIKLLLNGTDYTVKKRGDVYLLGDRNIEGLRITKTIPMKHRAVDKVIDFIPPELKKGVEIKTFGDLNSLIISGSQPRIEEIEDFLFDIDKVVPVIAIEVIIVDIQDSKTLASGITAGIGTAPATTGGTVLPLNMTLNSNSINSVLSGLSFGGINLGKVMPNFYITLNALDSRGLIKIRSTPKISTLNGHEAKISIGETQYYLETTNTVIGAQNPQNNISQNYKSVNADLAITVSPTVSSDEQITMEITVKQSSFTARISSTAPPGTVTRDLKSMMRVKNQEMILLGGLETNSTTDSGSGIPFLNRIPIIKWFFSTRTRSKTNNKLAVFIRPTVIY